MSADFTITVNPAEQQVLYLNGSGVVFTLRDNAVTYPEFTYIERAVLVARLRAWADRLESEGRR